jgi:hypothetical protein
MKRLPISAALLLLFAGVWFSLEHKDPSKSSAREDVVSKVVTRDRPNAIEQFPRQEAAASLVPAPQTSANTQQIPPPSLPPRVSHGIPITPEFVQNLARGPDAISISLPDGRTVSAIIEQRHTATDGTPTGVSGRINTPDKGTFHFRVQPAGSPAGPVIGAVVFENAEIAFRVLPGPDQTSHLAALPVDQVICRSYALPPENTNQPENIPAEHPTNIPVPPYQNGIIPLQSRPGALGVIYLDFDGQPGPHEGWGSFDAEAPPGMTPAHVKSIWARVSEDFAPFNLNVTTDLQVFLSAPETSRQRCIITPTNTASTGAGGVAYVGSFGWGGDTPCWCFYYSNAKFCAEIISHEIGHTLGLLHDGRSSPLEEYYLGHGSGSVSWAPLMGAGYYGTLTQWSKGEYLSANRQQDDLAIIAANPGVNFVSDDAGDAHANAASLETFIDGSVNSQGNISSQSDVDAFRFSTTGGEISLSISPVTDGPNLDINAGIYDSTDTLIISDNPDLGINSSLTTTLPAGSYTVRIDGTDRGNPLADGYTDYGSLGQYTVTGTIDGAIAPDRFTIEENSPLDSVIGDLLPRIDHGASPLTYAISSGNTNSAFTIDSETGTISVATPAALDFEALSSTWEQPPKFDLTVTITDSMFPALNESIRVVINVTDVNEAPVISGDSSIIAISHTKVGVALGTVTVTDPDAFDFATLAIVSGNATGEFSLDSKGLITVAGPLDAAVNSTYSLTIRATDNRIPNTTRDQIVTVTIIPASNNFTPGFVYHTIYDYIYGSNVVDLTGNPAFPTRPSREIELSSFSDKNQGDAYGSTIRAWMIAPVTGTYQFWIAADDSAELLLSTDGNPSSKSQVCSLGAFSNIQQWTKYPSQQSATYNLTAGQVCYLEARHKKDSGTDHLSVAWEIKNPLDTTILAPRQVIPGRYLSPHFLNYSPQIFASDVNLYRNSYAGYQVTTAFASDPNATDVLTWAITAGNDAGIFSIDPSTGQVTVANTSALMATGASSIPLTLTVTDNGNSPLSDSETLTIQLLSPSATPTAGLIQEYWDNIPGNSLSALTSNLKFPERPDRLVDLDSFDSGTIADTNNGSRIRAYVMAPTTGFYKFYIASDNAGSLLLSNDENPANAIQIASVASSTGYKDWTASPDQSSFPVPLAAGQRYYIEARVKQGTGIGHLAAAWSGPDIFEISVIGDFHTEPYDSNVPPRFPAPSYSFNLAPNYGVGTVAGTVAATDSPFEEVRYAIVSGDPLQAFAINPISGTITVNNPDNLIIGSIYQLQVGAQDSGHGRHFAPRETLVPVTIALPNDPPQFAANPFSLGTFPANQTISQSLGSAVSDPEDAITFTLVSGPSWASLSPTGLLSGTPGYADFGPHFLTVAANDGMGHTVQGVISLTVTTPSNFPTSTLTLSQATRTITSGTIDSGAEGDTSTSDNLYQTFRENESDDKSILNVTWEFVTPPNRTATLQIEAFHSANPENDHFQFSVSTDGGNSFNDAILVTKVADDDTRQSFTFPTGTGGLTIIKVLDTDRSSGLTDLDSLFIDQLVLQLAPNSVPTANNTTFQVAYQAPSGVSVGNVIAADPDSGQTLTYSIPRGNEAGRFTITPSGVLKVAADIPAGTGPYSLIVVATDNGSPTLANYAVVTVNVVAPIASTVTFENLSTTYNGASQSAFVITSPLNLPYKITYNGLPGAPTDAGIYSVVATIYDPLHTGSQSATLVIGKAPATIALEQLSQSFTGMPLGVTATTSPPNLAHSLTYNGSPVAPTAFGNYNVVATITDPNYSGSLSSVFSITKILTVSAGQTLNLPLTSETYQSIQNHGTLVLPSGSLSVTGNVTNSGTIRLYGNTAFNITGTFTNTGVIDVINWNRSLPLNLLNIGTILDRSAIRVLTTETNSTHFTLSIPNFEGHIYQLEATPDLIAPWQPLGDPISGTGTALAPSTLQFSPLLDGPQKFFRVMVTPPP